MGGGILPLGGTVKSCLLSTACTQSVALVLTQPTAVNGVPGFGTKGVGVGGLPGGHHHLAAGRALDDLDRDGMRR